MDHVIDANAALAISNNEHTATKHSKVHIVHLFLDYSISDDL